MSIIDVEGRTSGIAELGNKAGITYFSPILYSSSSPTPSIEVEAIDD